MYRDDCRHLTPDRRNCTHKDVLDGMPVSENFKECKYCPRYRSDQVSLFDTAVIDYRYQAQQWRLDNPTKWNELTYIMATLCAKALETGRKSVSFREAEMQLADRWKESCNHNYTRYNAEVFKEMNPQFAHLIKTRN